MFCPRCGNELNDGSHFCRFCGHTFDQSYDAQQEKDFLDTTHRLLRWERKAWSISGKVFLIFGIIIAELFVLLAMISMGNATSGYNDTFFAVYSAIMFVYAIIFGGIFIAIGIVNRVACNKIPRYLDSMHNDFKPTADRCGSIGMIVFTYFFNTIALVFFLINFVRMKTCKATIQRILNRQARTLPPC